MEKDDNKPADSIEVESEFIKDLPEQNGENSNLDAKDNHEKTDQNLSSPNPTLNGDLKVSEIIVQEEVILAFISTLFFMYLRKNSRFKYQCKQ